MYAQGLLMEEPPGSTEPLQELTESLQLHLQIYLHQKGNRHILLVQIEKSIIGLVDFYHNPEELFIRFICAIPPRQGLGTQMLRHLAEYCLTHDIALIKSTVSSLDQRACNFYFNRLGFQKVGTRVEEPGFDLYLAEIHPDILLKNIASAQPR